LPEHTAVAGGRSVAERGRCIDWARLPGTPDGARPTRAANRGTPKALAAGIDNIF
jgi:hypothetical protein